MMRRRNVERQARRLGYTLTRGAYYGTCDDRADRWYLVEIPGPVIDRRGPGCATLADVADALAEIDAEGKK